MPPWLKDQWGLQELGKHWTCLIDTKFGGECQIYSYCGQVFLYKNFPKFSWISVLSGAFSQNFAKNPKSVSVPNEILGSIDG